MSVEGITAFLQDLEEDEALQQQLAGALTGLEGEAAAAAVVGIGAGRGHEFTAAEAALARKMVTGGEDDVELSEAELELVAGGGWGSAGRSLGRYFTRDAPRSFAKAGSDVARWGEQTGKNIDRNVYRPVKREVTDFFRGW